MTSCSLPSSTAAKNTLDGAPGALVELACATLLRAALIAPGLYLAGVPRDKMVKGALLASVMISGFILVYLAAGKGR